MPGGHSTRAERALRRLAEDDPALGALALWCQHRDDPADSLRAVSTATTIRYGGAFEALALAEQAALAAHHILHIALGHAGRADALYRRFGAAFESDVYNLAADAVVNEVLAAAGYTLPRPYPTLEETLAAAGLAGDEATAARWDADTLYVRLMARRDGSGGEGHAIEAYARSRGFEADLEPGAGAGDDMVSDADWRERLSRALEAGRAAGRGIGARVGRFADMPEPRVPWEILLRGMLARVLAEGPRRSHARPSRRWLAAEAASRVGGTPVPGFEPGTERRRRIPSVAVALDVSTSIDAARLGLFAAQIAGIGQRSGAEVHVLVFDEEVRSETRLQGRNWAGEIAAIPLAEGGGTDFRPVLARARALAPSAIVVLTDLEGPLGEAPGRIPVIWAVPDGAPPAPPFGRVVSLAR
ncbi:MAG: VWA-like domain-containing protein [Pseudomonadota bacterium]